MPARAEGNTCLDVCISDDPMENVAVGRERSSHPAPAFCLGTWAPLQNRHSRISVPSQLSQVLSVAHQQAAEGTLECKAITSCAQCSLQPSVPVCVTWLLPITQRDPLKLEVTFQNCTSQPKPFATLDFTNLISPKRRADFPASRAGEEHRPVTASGFQPGLC